MDCEIVYNNATETCHIVLHDVTVVKFHDILLQPPPAGHLLFAERRSILKYFCENVLSDMTMWCCSLIFTRLVIVRLKNDFHCNDYSRRASLFPCCQRLLVRSGSGSGSKTDGVFICTDNYDQRFKLKSSKDQTVDIASDKVIDCLSAMASALSMEINICIPPNRLCNSNFVSQYIITSSSSSLHLHYDKHRIDKQYGNNINVIMQNSLAHCQNAMTVLKHKSIENYLFKKVSHLNTVLQRRARNWQVVHIWNDLAHDSLRLPSLYGSTHPQLTISSTCHWLS